MLVLKRIGKYATLAAAMTALLVALLDLPAEAGKKGAATSQRIRNKVIANTGSVVETLTGGRPAADQPAQPATRKALAKLLWARGWDSQATEALLHLAQLKGWGISETHSFAETGGPLAVYGALSEALETAGPETVIRAFSAAESRLPAETPRRSGPQDRSDGRVADYWKRSKSPLNGELPLPSNVKEWERGLARRVIEKTSYAAFEQMTKVQRNRAYRVVREEQYAEFRGLPRQEQGRILREYRLGEHEPEVLVKIAREAYWKEDEELYGQALAVVKKEIERISQSRGKFWKWDGAQQNAILEALSRSIEREDSGEKERFEELNFRVWAHRRGIEDYRVTDERWHQRTVRLDDGFRCFYCRPRNLESRARITRAVERLSADQRQILNLRVEGYTFREIAIQVARNPCAVRKQHKRTLARLKSDLGDLIP